MGSQYFLHCSTDERFGAESEVAVFENGDLWGGRWLVFDFDQRRTVEVWVPTEDNEDLVLNAAEEFIDDLPSHVMKIVLSKDGTMLSTNSGPANDDYYAPFYPPRTDFPSNVATVRRKDLTEVDRLGLHVDQVEYSPKPGERRQAVFKYYIIHKNVAIWWHEANCVMRMPPHPNIVPFDALVLDTVAGVDRVVGFTTRYIPGGTLHEHNDRVFKLKYLEQLIKTVDHLNLHLGIVHGDICPWNLLIDSETDSIQLFDFNSAAKLGWAGDEENRLEFGYDEDRNDVKFVIFTVYEIITREFCFRREFHPHELDAAKTMRKRKWVKHGDVQLDSPVEEFRRVLRGWVKERAKSDVKISHYNKAAEPLDWPMLKVDPEMISDYGRNRVLGKPRRFLVAAGKDFVRWERPASRKLPLPTGQRLLATGEVVET